MPDKYEVDNALNALLKRHRTGQGRRRPNQCPGIRPRDPREPRRQRLDALSDFEEVNVHGTHPTRRDTDGDLANDGEESTRMGRDPLVFDTDTDGMRDGYETIYGLGPANQRRRQPIPDGDNLTSLQEHALFTNPLLADTDGDGLNDDVEVALTTQPQTGRHRF
jgi:hypothetical protein